MARPSRPGTSILTHPPPGCATGYLPSFWVKLRVLAVPALNSTAVHHWPVRWKLCLRSREQGLHATVWKDCLQRPCLLPARLPVAGCHGILHRI